jgi:aminotransferase
LTGRIRINPEVAAIPYGDRKRIKTVAEARTDLIDLMSGNPDMEMPPFIRQRIKERVDSGPMRYTGYWGSPELLGRLSQHLVSECGIEANPNEEILITHGVQEALYTVMRTVLRRGDEVLIPTPHYANYLLDTVACGAEPVFVPLRESESFIPSIEDLEQAITPKTRLLVFSNPNNPLGITWPDDTIEAIANLVRGRDLLVAVDEIYRETFTLQGFSKSFFMMGMRVGYVTGPRELIHHVKQLHYVLLLCPSTIGQAAALAALDCPKEQIEPLRQEFRDKLQILYQAVESIPGVSCVQPQGTFYLFPNMRCFGETSMDLCLRLIQEAGVATLPGTEFGALGEGYLRLSVISKREQVEEGARRLKDFAQRNLDLGGGV